MTELLKQLLDLLKRLRDALVAQNAAKPIPPPTDPSQAKIDPATQESIPDMIHRVAKEEHLTSKQASELYATIFCESHFDPHAVNHNKRDGKVVSTDYGLCQINDHYHIGEGKQFPSVEYVLNNPEACVRWMCRMWKAGKARLWVCYDLGMYKQYL